MFTDKSLRALQPRKTTYRIFEKSVDKGFCAQLTPADASEKQTPAHNFPDGHGDRPDRQVHVLNT